MKAKSICMAIVSFCTVLVVAFCSLFYVDYSVYDEFREALKREGYAVERRWVYEEDFTLEDFGIFAQKGDIAFWLDVRHISDVKTLGSRIDGVLLQSLNDRANVKEWVLRFDSELWTRHGLPQPITVGDFIVRSQEIVPRLAQMKSVSPVTENAYWSGRFRNYIIIRDDDVSVSPVYDRIENAE